MPAPALYLCLALLALTLGARSAQAAGPAAACLAEKIITNQLNCLTTAAREAGDAKLCLLSDQPAVRFNCVALYAEQTRDPASCALIAAEDSAPPGVLQETCRVGVAIALMEPTLCAGFTTPNLEDACYLQMVEAGADAALCERIENPTLKDACGGE